MKLLFIVRYNLEDVNRYNTCNWLFDFVFFDADKENLIHYFDIVLPMVRVGGIIATDNILYPEEYRSMMTNYTNYIKNKPNIQSMMIPIGNGEELTIKLAWKWTFQ